MSGIDVLTDTRRNRPLFGIDVAVLAGGLGSRLRTVLGDDLPKILAPVGKRVFLDIVVDWLTGYGAARLILCLGHHGAKVANRAARRQDQGLEIIPLIEPMPMGTGGALRFATPYFRSDPVLVLNGDSWTSADLSQFLAEHRAKNSFISMLCVRVPNAARYGSVELADDGTIARFLEKAPSPSPGLINAGVYLLSQQALRALESSQAQSFERDFLETAAGGRIRAHVCADATFIDIGTPESYATAEFALNSVSPGSDP